MTPAGDQVERAADRFRDGLLTTLKELDRRRVRALDFRRQLAEHRNLLLLLGGGAVAVLLVVAVGGRMLSARAQDRATGRRRWEALGRAWRHPNRLATRARPPPAAARWITRLAMGALVAVGTRILAANVRRALPAPR